MIDQPLAIIFTLFIPLATIGVATINAGLNRTRSAAHGVLSSMCASAVAVLVFAVFGSAVSGPGGGLMHVIHVAGQAWGYAGAGQLFSRSIHADDPHSALVLIFNLFAVGLTAQIPVASGGERWRLAATCVSSAFLAGLLFPYVNCWLWGGGFLSQMGAIDAGGAGVIQVTGGLTALVLAWLLGPRHGKFTSQGIPMAMPGHNSVFVVLGSLLALLGWIGLSAAGGLLFYSGTTGSALFAALNTLIAASAGALAALITTRLRFGKPDTSLTANGWVAGLVAVSAGAPFYKVSEAILIGLVAGIVIVFAIEMIEARMHVDDPAGVIAVHAVGGLWGLMAAGIFGTSNPTQFLSQLTATGTLVGFVIPLAYGVNSLLNRFVPLRIEPSGERQGIDLFELGSGAYPEFVVQRDDFMRRG